MPAAMFCRTTMRREGSLFRMPKLFVCGGGMNLLEGFWWGKFLVCGLRVANDVSALLDQSALGKRAFVVKWSY
jgi:hypothetical protein